MASTIFYWGITLNKKQLIDIFKKDCETKGIQFDEEELGKLIYKESQSFGENGNLMTIVETDVKFTVANIGANENFDSKIMGEVSTIIGVPVCRLDVSWTGACVVPCESDIGESVKKAVSDYLKKWNIDIAPRMIAYTNAEL